MNFEGFEARKRDHLRLAMESRNEASGGSGLDQIHLQHRALPELNLRDVQIASDFFGQKSASPCFISSMTAGHSDAEALNFRLGDAAQARKWPMGLGSQRRELEAPEALEESRRLRKRLPQATFFSNLGLAQVISSSTESIQKILDALEPQALIVHLNPLQEALQPEGTPNFSGGVAALAKLSKAISLPIIVKETGCGFSPADYRALEESGVTVVDVAGFGGTHWGRIEGDRAPDASPLQEAAKTFAFWGESTVDSLATAQAWKTSSRSPISIWASGGIRSGLDVAKCLALGAERVGFAKPALQAALAGEEALHRWMDQVELELRIALLCTGSRTPGELNQRDKWRRI